MYNRKIIFTLEDIEVYFLRKDASSETFCKIAKAVINKVLQETSLVVETPKYTFRNERIVYTADLKVSSSMGLLCSAANARSVVLALSFIRNFAYFLNFTLLY